MYKTEQTVELAGLVLVIVLLGTAWRSCKPSANLCRIIRETLPSNALVSLTYGRNDYHNKRISRNRETTADIGCRKIRVGAFGHGCSDCPELCCTSPQTPRGVHDPAQPSELSLLCPRSLRSLSDRPRSLGSISVQMCVLLRLRRELR